MKKFSSFYGQVLNTMKSNTLAKMWDEDIEKYLLDLTLRAIAEFRFPKVSLDYEIIENEHGEEEYAFKNDVTQRELNVLLAIIKKYWLEQQIDSEEHFEDLYYDRDVRTFSRGNMMKSLRERYELAVKQAETAQYNYSRLPDSEGRPAIGSIYDDE